MCVCIFFFLLVTAGEDDGMTVHLCFQLMRVKMLSPRVLRVHCRWNWMTSKRGFSHRWWVFGIRRRTRRRQFHHSKKKLRGDTMPGYCRTQCCVNILKCVSPVKYLHLRSFINLHTTNRLFQVVLLACNSNQNPHCEHFLSKMKGPGFCC